MSSEPKLFSTPWISRVVVFLFSTVQLLHSRVLDVVVLSVPSR